MIKTNGYVNHASMLINAGRFRSTNTLVILMFQNAVQKVCHCERKSLGIQSLVQDQFESFSLDRFDRFAHSHPPDVVSRVYRFFRMQSFIYKLFFKVSSFFKVWIFSSFSPVNLSLFFDILMHDLTYQQQLIICSLYTDVLFSFRSFRVVERGARERKNKSIFFFPHHYPLALAVNKSPAVIFYHARSTDFEERIDRSVNRLYYLLFACPQAILRHNFYIHTKENHLHEAGPKKRCTFFRYI